MMQEGMPQDSGEQMLYGLHLEGALAPMGFRVPKPFRVDREGVWIIEASKSGDPIQVPIIKVPVLPVRLVVPAAGATGIQRAVLAYGGFGGVWSYRWVPCSVLLSHTRITALADLGVWVDSLTARKAVAYFSEVLTANRPPHGGGLPESYGVTRMGWHDLPCGRVFVLGRAAYSEDGQVYHVSSPDEDGPPDLIVLDADERDPWIRQGVGAIRVRGTVRGWAQALTGVEQYPRALLALYASFVPPLLELLDRPNFLVEYAYDTSTGKSTALRIAASVWGVPDTLGGSGGLGYMVSGDMTKNALEGIAGLYNCLPVLLDDLHRMEPDAQARTVYMLAHGAGKSRAAPVGMRETQAFRTVALVTAERSIVGHRGLGGLGARMVSISGLPLAQVGGAERALAERLRRELLCHHGTAGVEFVQHLQRVATGGMQAELQQARQFVVGLQQRLSTSGIPLPAQAARHMEYAELLALAAILAHQCLPLSWIPDVGLQALAEVLAESILQLEEHDLGTEALEYLQSRLSPLVDPGSETVVDPAGRQIVGSARREQYVALLPHFFEDLLRARGLDPRTVLRVFADRGWIHLNASGGKRYLRPMWRYRGQLRRMVVLHWEPLMGEKAATAPEPSGAPVW